MKRLLLALILIAVTASAITFWQSKASLQFEMVHASPIRQNLTRAAFTWGDQLFFSTLENYDSSIPSRTLLASASLNDLRSITSQTLDGSNEIRSFVFSSEEKAFYLAGSLNPQLFRWDPSTSSARKIFQLRGGSGWFHQIAQDSTAIYATLSSASILPKGLSGILRINKQSGDSSLSPMPPSATQTYGGVQTVDPTGRVWFYRAYPFQSFWNDKYGIRDRELPGYAGWEVEAWDIYEGETYFNLVRGSARQKVCVDGVQLQQKVGCLASSEFRSKLRLDLYRQNASLGEWYWDTKEQRLYLRVNDRFVAQKPLRLGRIRTSTVASAPQEFPVVWDHPSEGEIAVVGSRKGEPVIWKVGTKAYALGETADRFVEVPLENLSPATISALAHDELGNVYGGGLLTRTNLFRYSPQNKSSTLLPPVVDDAIGQVNALFTGASGKIFGSIYPDSSLFKYDSARPWKTGVNPQIFRFRDPPTLMRAYRGIEDSNGDLYFQSTSDYSAILSRALQVAHPSTGVATALFDPGVVDVAAWDDSKLAVLFREGESTKLGTIDKTSKLITNSVPLGTGDAFIASAQDANGVCGRFLLFENTLFAIDDSLSLHKLFQPSRTVRKIYPASCREIFLVGTDILVRLTGNGKKYSAQTWTHFGALGQKLFYEDHWLPMTLVNRRLYIAHKEQLWATDVPDSN